MPDPEEPKILVDSDWKAQAQQEKQRLAEQEQKSQSPGGDAAGQDEGMPQADFEGLVQMLATQALMYLGAVPDPQTGRAIVAPEYARLHIDMLGVVEDKTRGNLSQEESALLTGVLSELRLQYVEISKAIAKAVAEGKIKPGVAPDAPPGPTA